MNSLGYTIVNFVEFFPLIEKALDDKNMYSSRMIFTKDYPFLIPAFQTYLIRKCGIFSLVGYVEEPILTNWFDSETLIEEFDDLLLEFRDFLITGKGLDMGERYTLVRYMDGLNFIIAQGEPNDPIFNDQHFPLVENSVEVVTESDPFL